MGEPRKSEDEEIVEGSHWYPTGYRTWNISAHKGLYRLIGPVTKDIWEPEVEYGKDPITGEVVPVKIVKSDWKEEFEPLEKSYLGLHSKKTPEGVFKEFPHGHVYGSVLHFGKVHEGEEGYKSHKAKVTALFRRYPACFICRKPAKYFVHNDIQYPLCDRCLKRVEKLIKRRGYTEEEFMELLEKLASVYEADIVEPSKES